MRAIRTRSGIVKLGAVAVLFLGVGGAAYAAQSSPFIGPAGNINSCVAPHGGYAKVWPPGHRCSGGWLPLAWAAAGATGPAGATGATGATGPLNPSAATVNGQAVTKLLLKEPTPGSGTTTATLYGTDGLTILADCSSSGSASLVANGPSSNDSELMFSGSGTTGAFNGQSDTLGSASNEPLGPAGSGNVSFSYASSAGSVLTGTIGYQSGTAFASYSGCAFFGDVTSG
ncbi:MAG: hypothetical protein ABSC56_05820 [Solirubrobacteraceae bacterium]|jgi:hypothetical protein